MKKKTSFVLAVLGICLLAGFRLGFCGNNAEAGLITRLEGNVQYCEEGKETFESAKTFMKIYVNDRLKIPENGKAGLLLQANGRKETWNGPVTIVVGELESVVRSGKKTREPEVQDLSVSVTDRVFTVTTQVREAARGRAGIHVVRDTESFKESLEQKLKTYKNLKEKTTETDILPELYLLSVYAEFGKKDKMKQQIETIKNRWPNYPEIDDWEASLK